MDGSGGSGAYRIGIYVRESRDDNEENYETIETQRALLENFIAKEKIGRICNVYIDDNVSGSIFEREGINMLKHDVESGRINMLVLKDLSRLGRNNAKTLLFLDYLEEYGVRVITFDGRYDSDKDNDIVGIETWFNERYIKDISRKIRASLRFKIEKGEYIGSAPYGYVKSAEAKNRLCIDDGAAHVVREIFGLYRKGYGYASIAKILDSRGCPPPSANAGGTKFEKGVICNTRGWNPVAVRRIIMNRVYTGDTVQGVSEKVSFKGKKTRRLPEDRWVVTPDTHEAIIVREEFEEVQRIRLGRKAHPSPNKGRLHLFKGILYCGKCGSPMYARVRKNRPPGYICGNYGRNGTAACTSHHVSEYFVKNIIINELLDLLKNGELVEKAKSMAHGLFLERRAAEGRLEKLKEQLLHRQRQQEAIYMDKLEGRISGQLFTRMNAALESRILLLKEEIDAAGNRGTVIPDIDEIVRQMEVELLGGNIARDMVAVIVEKIIVSNAGDGFRTDILVNGYPEGCCNSAGAEKGAIVVDFKINKV